VAAARNLASRSSLGGREERRSGRERILERVGCGPGFGGAGDGKSTARGKLTASPTFHGAWVPTSVKQRLHPMVTKI
jgi:hypothetical protein